MLQVLIANKSLESELKLHRFSFSLNDSAEDPEPLPAPQWMVDYAGLEDELPMCVILPRFVEAEVFALEHSLNSVFRQNYSNYRAVIFGSGSPQQQDFLGRYLRLSNISADNYRLVRDSSKKTALERIREAVHNHCPEKSFAFVLEAGNAFLTRNVLKDFNGRFNHYLYGLVWSNHFEINEKERFGM